MDLLIRGLSFNDGPLPKELVGRFDRRGGTIGRAFSATLALPDPERLISRIQANVLVEGDGFWLEDVGRSRSIMHNGELLEAGARRALAPGDDLLIGGYRLAVEIEEGEIEEDEPAEVTPADEPTPAAAVEPSIDDLLGLQPGPALAPPLAASGPAGSGSSALEGGAPGGAEDIWRGFLDGVGVDVALPNGITPAMMRTIGLMLRASVEGLLQLILMRAAAKEELRADRTIIQAQQNNPLKFSPDVNVALMQLLRPPGRGFLSGVAAIQDAVDDLRSHQVGTMAGMRFALEGVLKRFDPALLERRLADRSLLETLLPMNRKARLWELFLQNYARISSEAEEDFHALFGEAFMEAYSEQVRALKERGREARRPGRP